MYSVVKMVKNTHRHPANQALHCIGAPFYIIGLVMIFGHFAGMQTNPVMGAAMWLSAIAMFVAGHKIESNLGSTTPVLLFRLLSKVVRNLVAQRVHLLRAWFGPVLEH